MQKIITVGANGYIGKLLHLSAQKITLSYGTCSTGADGLLGLRLESPDLFDYKIIDPSDVVLLTAAISAPDVCSRDRAHAVAVNVTGSTEFISRVMDRGGRIIFFSSDTVYGERNDPFDEQVASNPAGDYAEMKHEVENRFLGNPLFKVIRLSYVFSRDDKFTNYLSGCAERGEEADLFHPFYRAIIHRGDVVDGALALAQHWDKFPQQVINFGGPEVLSRIDFAEFLKCATLPNLKYRVTEPGDDFFKNRPRIIAMSSNVLPDLLGRSSRSLHEAVQIEFVPS